MLDRTEKHPQESVNTKTQRRPTARPVAQPNITTAILTLQRTAGNRGTTVQVQRLPEAARVQARKTIIDRITAFNAAIPMQQEGVESDLWDLEFRGENLEKRLDRALVNAANTQEAIDILEAEFPHLRAARVRADNEAKRAQLTAAKAQVASITFQPQLFDKVMQGLLPYALVARERTLWDRDTCPSKEDNESDQVLFQLPGFIDELKNGDRKTRKLFDTALSSDADVRPYRALLSNNAFVTWLDAASKSSGCVQQLLAKLVTVKAWYDDNVG